MKTFDAHDKSTEADNNSPKPIQSRNSTIDTPAFVTNSIGWRLQGGVIVSSILVLLGLILLPTRPGGLSITRLLNFPQDTQ